MASRFGDELGDRDRIQVKIIKQPAFVLDGSDRKFKSLCYELSNDFQRRVSMRLDTHRVSTGSDSDRVGSVTEYVRDPVATAPGTDPILVHVVLSRG